MQLCQESSEGKYVLPQTNVAPNKAIYSIGHTCAEPSHGRGGRKLGKSLSGETEAVYGGLCLCIGSHICSEGSNSCSNVGFILGGGGLEA